MLCLLPPHSRLVAILVEDRLLVEIIALRFSAGQDIFDIMEK